jgi:uncharacterized phage-associated protein
MNDETRKHVVLTPNARRIQAALYHVMLEAQRRGQNVSQYDLVKTLFLADRAHLNEWGRPVTYDNYSAMKHGPVPSLAYDFLKSNANSLREHRIDILPWTSVERANSVRHFFPNENALDVDLYLSSSDLEALDDALGMVLRLGFSQIRKLTHEDPAYLDAWREGGVKAAYEMKLGLLYERPDFERAEMLAEYSPYV